MKKSSVLLFILFLFFESVGTSQSAIINFYEGNHTIDDDTYCNDNVNMYNNSIVNVENSGEIYWLTTYDVSTVNMNDGEVWYMDLRSGSTANMNGGGVYAIWTSNNSTLNLNSRGAGCSYDMIACDNSIVNMSGWQFDDTINIYDNSILNMSGGSAFSIDTAHNAVLNISGGSFYSIDLSSWIYSNHCTLNLYGKHFHMSRDEDIYYLSGELSDGTILDNVSLYVSNFRGSINFVPIPIPIWLLGSGLLSLVGLRSLGRDNQ